LVALILNLAAIGFLYYKRIDDTIPNHLLVFEDGELELNLNLPVSGEWEEAAKVFNNQTSLDFSGPIRMELKKAGSYQINLKLFGFIKWKNIEIEVVERQKVIPGGLPIGIYVKTDGLLVLGTGILTGEDGLTYEPALNIVKTGDYIETVNGSKVETITAFQEEIEKSDGEELTVGIRRDGVQTKVKIKPVKTGAGTYKLGIWVRQDTQGIGTLTYYTSEGEFGALGHGITDSDTGELLEIKEGEIYQTNIINIIKGQQGQPGELVGYINRTNSSVLGELKTNTTCGIFGSKATIDEDGQQAEEVEIALKQEVKTGRASILCQIDGELKEYEIQIEKLRYNTEDKNKGMVIKITDEELLEKTNGIVQGMSGSPILQDGKLVGAVTHVFVQNSTKGYGIFIENMLKQ
jgi:stage IV sporulation protein B